MPLYPLISHDDTIPLNSPLNDATNEIPLRYIPLFIDTTIILPLKSRKNHHFPRLVVQGRVQGSGGALRC